MDSVSANIDVWTAQMPPVDQAVEELHQRVGRIARLLDRLLDQVAEVQQISRGDWTALSVIIRNNGTCTPTELGRALELTSGTVSVRIKRLAQAGLIESTDRGAADARSRPIRATATGRHVWATATADRTEREAHIVRHALSGKSLDDVNAGLAAILGAFEDHLGPGAQHDLPRSATER